MGDTCSIKEPKNIKSPSHINKYLRIVPRIAFYLKNKNNSAIFKYKCPLFAVGGTNGRIYLFNNSLEHMGTFVGHKMLISSLCRISNKILASGSWDNNIKTWDIEERIIITTLSGHTNWVTALCHLGCGQLVSGSWDKSLIIWDKLPGSSSNYSNKQQLRGHKSIISGIIKINKREIISGDYSGDLKIWNIDEGVCIRHIPSLGGYKNQGLCQGYLPLMKQHHDGDVAIDCYDKVFVWGAVNNWETPIKQFPVSPGYSLEFLHRDILLRGGCEHQLEFIDYAQAGYSLPSSIIGLHSKLITAIQRIAKNILVTASVDGSLKVINPISRKCYLKFKKGRKWMTAITYFY